MTDSYSKDRLGNLPSRPYCTKENIWVILIKQLKFRKNLFCIGDRYWNVIHFKMQMNCSPLKEHLANSLHVLQNSTCDFGLSVESNTHFVLECRLFTQHRQSMLNKLQGLPMITTDLLLYGDINLTFEPNKVFFEAVREFLKESGRFS